MSSPASDPQYGMALSGGGFRASLFHLGVVRFLRDARLLRRVTNITSVSGGSIIGAHMALNWDRYCGTEQEFDQVAQEQAGAGAGRRRQVEPAVPRCPGSVAERTAV